MARGVHGAENQGHEHADGSFEDPATCGNRGGFGVVRRTLVASSRSRAESKWMRFRARIKVEPDGVDEQNFIRGGGLGDLAESGRALTSVVTTKCASLSESPRVA